MKHIHDIPGYDTFAKIEPITKGWPGDKKYCIETTANRRMMLRVSDISGLAGKQAEYELMERIYGLGVPVPQPLGFGMCDGGKSMYALSEWVDGQDADTLLPHLSPAAQYALGIKTGAVLQKIHALPAPESSEPWHMRFHRKVQYWVDEYRANPQVHSELGEMIIGYLASHSDVLDSCIQTFIHGDYNIENIIVTSNGEIRVIDFSGYNTSYGDPWWDMHNMAWMPTMYPHFYSGQIKGAFNGAPPKHFWQVLTYYFAYDALAALTDPYGLNGIEDGTDIVNNILQWTNHFKGTVPTWYSGLS